MTTIIALFLAAQSATPLNPLQPLEFVVGSCWRGNFPDGPQTDTHCFTPMLAGAFVRDVHVVEGAPAPYSGETLYRWDGAASRIRFDYYASDGAHSQGVALPAPGGLSFPTETRTAPDGSEMTIRSSWTRDGADAYLVIAEAWDGEGWRELWRMRMVRTGPAR
jgi:hypothetical protein